MAMTPLPDMENDPQLAALYRAGTDVEPPAHLDDAIRAAARREVTAGPRRAGIRRWTVPVSLAAVLVLSVSVVSMMREQGADRPEALIQPQAEAPAAAMHSEIAKKEIAEPPTAVAQDAAPKRRSPVTEPATPLAQAEAPASTPAPALSSRAAEPERSATDSRARDMAAESSNRAEDTAAARRESAPQPMLRSAPAPAPMADAASGAGVSAAKPAAPAAAFSTNPARSALWQDLIRESPEKWIQRIAELRRTGQTADADALLAEFRRRFPDARLPEDLR